MGPLIIYILGAAPSILTGPLWAGFCCQSNDLKVLFSKKPCGPPVKVTTRTRGFYHRNWGPPHLSYIHNIFTSQIQKLPKSDVYFSPSPKNLNKNPNKTESESKVPPPSSSSVDRWIRSEPGWWYHWSVGWLL